jgi:hypothetical protein
MKVRLVAVVLALPLVAFDCGGEEEVRSPVGCTLQVRGAVSEDLWCIVAAYDYSAFPVVPQDQWGFILTAYRGTMEVGAGVGMFLGGRPTLGTVYGWNGATRSALLTDGGAQRYGGSMFSEPPTYTQTHSAESIIETGSLFIQLSAIPPANAMNEELIGVHGTLAGTLPSESGGDPVTIVATF